MNWPDLTEERIHSFQCPEGKFQQLYWDGACPSLGVRVMPSGAKSFIFDSKVRRVVPAKKMRITIGDVRSWSIQDAREQASRYKRMTDTGIDPRTTLHIPRWG